MSENESDKYQYAKVQLNNFLDTADPAIATKVNEFFTGAEQSGTISRITGVELYDTTTKQAILDITIRRTDLNGVRTPTHELGRKDFFTAIGSLTSHMEPLVRIQAQQINDDDTEGNIRRSTAGIEGKNPYPNAKIIFDQSFVQKTPQLYSSH